MPIWVNKKITKITKKKIKYSYIKPIQFYLQKCINLVKKSYQKQTRLEQGLYYFKIHITKLKTLGKTR
jgi:hypothetical protein